MSSDELASFFDSALHFNDIAATSVYAGGQKHSISQWEIQQRAAAAKKLQKQNKANVKMMLKAAQVTARQEAQRKAKEAQRQAEGELEQYKKIAIQNVSDEEKKSKAWGRLTTEIWQVCKNWDTSNDGFISREELHAGMNSVQPTSITETNEMFTKAAKPHAKRMNIIDLCKAISPDPNP